MGDGYKVTAEEYFTIKNNIKLILQYIDALGDINGTETVDIGQFYKNHIKLRVNMLREIYGINLDRLRFVDFSDRDENEQ